MANTISAKKMTRKIAARTECNKSRRSRVRTFIRRVEEAISEKDAESARLAMLQTESEIMKAVSRGVIHRKTAARKVSRLTLRVRSIGQ